MIDQIFNFVRNTGLIREKKEKIMQLKLSKINAYKRTPRQKSIRALEIFRVQKLILNATS